MPFIDSGDLNNVSTPSIQGEPQPEPEDKIDTTFTGTIREAFKLDNSVFNVVKESVDIDTLNFKEKGYDVFDDIEGYEEYADMFIGVANPSRASQLKNDIDLEMDTKRYLDSAPTWQSVTARLAANVIDPISIMPIIKGVQLASRAGRFAKGAAQGAALGGLSGISREAILQKSQETKTAQESVINIVAESAFGALLGGGIAALPSSAKLAGQRILAKAMKGEDFQIRIDKDGGMSIERSVGAKEVVTDIEDEGLAYLNNKVLKGAAHAASGFGVDLVTSPVYRGVTSRFGTVRQFTNSMFAHNFILGKETKGVASPVRAEELMRRDDARMVDVNSKVSDLYTRHTGVGKIRSSNSLTRPEGRISFDEFNERISKSLRDDTYIDAIPEVADATVLYRNLLDDYAKQMQKLELLPADLPTKTLRNYLTRVYNVKHLESAGGRKAFIDKVSGWYSKYNKDGTLRNKPMDEFEAKDAAETTLNRILGEDDKSLSFNSFSNDLVSKGKFVKSRSLLMPDSELEEFLVNDAQFLVTQYSRRASGLIRTQEQLESMGFKSVGDVQQQLKLDKDKALEEATSDAERSKIQKAFNNDNKLVADIYSLMNGTLYKPNQYNRAIETLLQFNTTRLLGGVTLSSFPELAMAPYRMGLLNTIRDGYVPMLRSFKTAKLAKDQFRDIDVGLELEMNNTLRALSDTNMTLGTGHTKFDRRMQQTLDIFGKASGLSYFTAGGRRIAAHVASADLIRMMHKLRDGTAPTQKEIVKLANLGLQKKNKYEQLINAMDGPNGVTKAKGSFIANYTDWADQEAADLFRTAIQRQVESIILKPSKGDIPLFAQSTGLGRLLFQFKSFISSATNKIAISSLQRRDARTLAGLSYLTTMGMVSGMVKDTIAGREISDSPAEQMLEGVSRSGFLGLVMSTPLDVGMTMYNKKSRRYGGSHLQGQVIGPTFGLIKDVGDVAARLGDGKVTDSDIKAGLRTLPFNNLFYIKYLSDQAFDN